MPNEQFFGLLDALPTQPAQECRRHVLSRWFFISHAQYPAAPCAGHERVDRPPSVSGFHLGLPDHEAVGVEADAVEAVRGDLDRY